MLPQIELSPQALIEIRIKALENTYRHLYKTIDYANKLLLEHELGTAYLKLMELKKSNHGNNRTKKPISEDYYSSQLNKETTARTHAATVGPCAPKMDMPKLRKHHIQRKLVPPITQR